MPGDESEDGHADEHDLVPVGTSKRMTNLLILRDTFFLSIRMMFAGIYGCFFIVLLFYFPRTHQFPNFVLDTTKNEPLFLHNPASEGWWADTQRHITYDIPFVLYIPVSFSIYLRLPVRKALLIVLASLVGYIPLNLTRKARSSTWIGTRMSALAPYLFTALVLRCFLKEGKNNVYWHVIVQIFTILACIFFIGLVNVIPADSATHQIILLCFIIPVVRECCYTIVRQSGSTLTLSSSVAGEVSQVVNRGATWLFFIWFQFALATVVRLYFTNIDDTSTMAMILAYQSVMELVLRYTLPYRDDALRRCLRRCFKGKHRLNETVTADTVVPLEISKVESKGISSSFERTGNGTGKQKSSSGRRSMVVTFAEQSRLATGLNEAREAKRAYCSMVILGDMLAEYVGIFTAGAILVLYRKNLLQIPLDYFRHNPKVFDEPVEVGPIMFWMVTQLVTELMVDTFSSFLEIKRGYRIIEVWHGKTRYFWGLVALACGYAAIASYSMLGLRDVHLKCLGYNICKCADGNGLQPGGLLDLYCLRLYPDTNGYNASKTLV